MNVLIGRKEQHELVLAEIFLLTFSALLDFQQSSVKDNGCSVGTEWY